MTVDIRCQDCCEGLKELESECAQVVICDPPYNIGKDFGNDSDRQEFTKYLAWCKEWLAECVRILRPDGTLYVYGFSEILAHIQMQLPSGLNVRWLIWHYTNKNVPSLKFWQRSHESILCVWKKSGGKYPAFNVDDVREPYTDTYLKNAAGKTRKATKGRFGTTETTYTAHEKGALPRDVIKVPALAGGAGKKERGDLATQHPTQKPLELCDKLLRAGLRSGKANLVVVPFVGSGSECVAAQSLGACVIGFEINESYVSSARERALQASAAASSAASSSTTSSTISAMAELTIASTSSAASSSSG